MVKQSFLTAFLTVGFAVLVLYLFPWDKVHIGNNPLFPRSTITVTGEAKGSQKKQIAKYNVNVSASNDDKNKANDDVNTKMTNIINGIKAMGIADDDIKTENIRVYQKPQPLMYAPGGAQIRPSGGGNGAWQANNSIAITLRDISKASALSDLLNKSGATNVYGPTYTVDNTTNTQADILGAAIEAARKKAQIIATVSGRTLGKAITISECNQYGGIMPLLDTNAIGAGIVSPSTPLQPGTQTVYKTLTLTFEFRYSIPFPFRVQTPHIPIPI